MKIELMNNGELVDSRSKFGTLEVYPKSAIKPTRIFMRNIQTLVLVYHIPKKIELIDFGDEFGDGKISVAVGYYASWYEECIEQLLIPMMV